MNNYGYVKVVTGKKEISKWVILEDGKFNIVWDSITNTFYVISMILIPIVLASNMILLSKVELFELVIDAWLLADIFI